MQRGNGARMEQGQEPSVEDILRSIKRVIAENDDVRAQTRPTLRQPRLRPAEDVHSTPAPDAADVLDLSELDMAPDGPDSVEALVADETAQSVRHSLAALAAMTEPGARPQIVRSGETSLEGMVRDMLRPMLKEWLDANLPAMVEKAIAAEIARLRR